MSTKPTMADVLELHRIGHTIGYAVHCVCDPEIGMSPDVFYRHQAAMLAAAGYGERTIEVEVRGWSSEDHPIAYNQGYEDAVTQGLADDPTLAGDWLDERLAAAKAGALREAADDLGGFGDTVPPKAHIEVADWLRDRACKVGGAYKHTFWCWGGNHEGVCRRVR